MNELGHQALSTYGIGADLSIAQWRSIVRQLIVRGFINSDAERYGALALNENSRPLLQGQIALHLREDVSEPKLRKKVRRHAGVSDADSNLWDALRACRKDLADEFGIAPYMVFHDATLMEMMEHTPTSESDLLNISGVGESKLDKFGQAFLKVIRDQIS